MSVQSPQFRAVSDNADAIVGAIVACGPKSIAGIAESLKKLTLIPGDHVLPKLAALESATESSRSRKVKDLLRRVQTVIIRNHMLADLR